jgi:hypothetical protein
MTPASSGRLARPSHGVPLALVLGVWAASVGMSGCGRNTVELVPAAGVLTVGGKPQADIEVQFMPDSNSGAVGPTSYGVTGDDGRFELRVRDGRAGAVPGRHLVIVTDINEERPPQGQSLTRPPRVDPRYATIGGGLTAEVGRASESIDITIPLAGKSR